MQLDPARVRHNATLSKTEDLIERVTAFRAGMEPEAIVIIESELESRGVTRDEIAARRREWQAKALLDPEGRVVTCWWCDGPAVSRRVIWWRLFGLLPLFPMKVPECEGHAEGRGIP